MRPNLTALAWAGDLLPMGQVGAAGWEAVEKSTGGMGLRDLVVAALHMDPLAVRAIFDVAARHVDFDSAAQSQPFARLARSALAPVLLSWRGYREVSAATVVDALTPWEDRHRGRH